MSNSRGRCRQSGVMYKIECSECDHVYFGETSRNAYTRGCEHTRSLDRGREDSVLYKHIIEQHRNSADTPQFNMRVISKHPTALDRQIAESVRIANSSHDRIMNSKQEFGHNKNWRVQRLTVLVSLLTGSNTEVPLPMFTNGSTSLPPSLIIIRRRRMNTSAD